MDGAMTFSAMIDMWQDRYHGARAGMDVVKVRQSDEFIQKQQHLEIEFNALQPLSERFLSLVLGRNRGRTAVEQAAGASLCFFPRLFGIATVDDLPAAMVGKLSATLQDSFFLGMACHFVLQNHPSRPRIKEVNLTALFEDFLKESISAEIKMGAYNKSVNNIPRDIFDVQYTMVAPIVKDDLRVGFWKRGKVRSNYHNVFCSGILLPMMTEIRASNL
jgi:hypothetical protein